MDLNNLYVPVRHLHLAAVTLSISLFAARGAAVLHAAADAMLAVHNAAKLHDLATGIAAIMKQH